MPRLISVKRALYGLSAEEEEEKMIAQANAALNNGRTF